MNECKKKGCSLCRGIQELNKKDGLVKTGNHVDVTDIRSKELGLFLLVIIILAAVIITALSVYYRANSIQNDDKNSPVAMIYDS